MRIENHIYLLKPEPCWFSAPGERDLDFLPAFGAVSKAVQIALREGLPTAYFQSMDEFQDRERANAILLFQATPPFHAKIRTDLTYDVLNPKILQILARKSRKRLIHLLASVESKLRVTGLFELAPEYAPRQAAVILDSVQRLARSRRCLLGLIRGEGVLVDALVRLGGAGDLSARKQRIQMASFRKKWTYQLRRMCNRRDFSSLGPSILDAATQALASWNHDRKGVSL